MSYGALGLVEVVGSCNAVVVLDQMQNIRCGIPYLAYQVRRSRNYILKWRYSSSKGSSRCCKGKPAL